MTSLSAKIGMSNLHHEIITGRKMYKVVREIHDQETGKIFREGDTVTIHFEGGGGCGGCTITQITDRGIHFVQGKGREKTAAFSKITVIS